MTFREEWFGTHSQTALAHLYHRVADLEGAVVEVGCWEGRSTCALANAAHPETVHAVDTWNGSPGELSAKLAAEAGRDVYATFLANVAELTAGNVVAHRMGWRDYFALNHCQSTPIKFLHIDAEHTYTEVRDNIEAALPLMAAGGIICGDDNHHPPVQQAVIDTLGDAGLLATLWYWTAS